MNRTIRSVDGQKDLKNSLELVETVFTEAEGEESGKTVRSLVEEIRSKQYYQPMKITLIHNQRNGV